MNTDKLLQEAKQFLRESPYVPDEKTHWVAIGLDSNSRKAYLFHFNKEKQANKVVDFFENYGDHTIFFVDYHGFTTIDRVEKSYAEVEISDGTQLHMQPERYVTWIMDYLKGKRKSFTRQRS